MATLVRRLGLLSSIGLVIGITIGGGIGGLMTATDSTGLGDTLRDVLLLCAVALAQERPSLDHPEGAGQEAALLAPDLAVAMVERARAKLAVDGVERLPVEIAMTAHVRTFKAITY